MVAAGIHRAPDLLQRAPNSGQLLEELVMEHKLQLTPVGCSQSEWQSVTAPLKMGPMIYTDYYDLTTEGQAEIGPR